MADPTAVNSQITDSINPAPDGASAQRGRFVWHDLMTPDVAKAQRYYADLLGWTYTDAGMEGMDYQMIRAGGTEWGGFMPADPAQSGPAQWISYVNVPDVDAAVAKAEELGGQAPVPPTDIPGVGRFAMIVSPTGAAISPYASATHAPETDPTPVQGIFCWHELLSADPAADGRFFSEVFGWRIEDVPMGEMGTYHLFKRLDTGKDAGGMMPKPDAEGGLSSWLPYVLVDDADATARRVGELGGTVCVQPMDIPDVGRMLVTTDPTGAFIAFLQPPTGQGTATG